MRRKVGSYSAKTPTTSDILAWSRVMLCIAGMMLSAREAFWRSWLGPFLRIVYIALDVLLVVI